MAEFLSNYGLFLAKTVTIALMALLLAGVIISMAHRGPGKAKDYIEVKNLNDKYKTMRQTLRKHVLNKKEFKKLIKAERKANKEESEKDTDNGRKKSIFVINFDGDINASGVGALREEITALLTMATPADQVVVRLDSNGGSFHNYGLAASQLQRLKNKKIPVTVAVDKIAASGGYMMACVADRLVAAPFAVIGSIGVIAQLPNFYRLLKKSDIDFEQITAGEYKRTLSLFGENTQKARKKVYEQVEDTHTLFKDFIALHRSNVDIEKVATGEYWYGSRALALNLVDDLMTSDDLLLSQSENADLYEINYLVHKSLKEKVTSLMDLMIKKVIYTFWHISQENRLQ